MTIQRRDFLTLLGGAAAWPVAVRAQQGERMRRVAVLMGFVESDPIAQSMVVALRSTLARLGVEGRKQSSIELRWAGPDPDRASTLARELAELRPEAVLGQTTPVVRALAREMPATPIVFMTVTDPIGSGFAASLARPGGNITGFTVDDSALGGKWVELLKQVAPDTTRVSLQFHPTGPPLEFFMSSIQAGASSFDVRLSVASLSSRDEIEGVIAAQARERGGGLIVLPNAFNTTNRELIIALAARYGVPAIYYSAYCAQSGGLIGYGSDYIEHARLAAGYMDRVLRGTKPADLPVQAPVKFELVINLKTPQALGLTVPSTLLAIADEVIE